MGRSDLQQTCKSVFHVESTWKQSGMDVEKVEKLAKIYSNVSIARGLLSNSVTDTAESRIISEKLKLNND
jgi:hypothetical protein